MARTANTAPLTDTEKAAKKAAASRAKLARDRKNSLAPVQSAVSRAAATLAAGDIAKHLEWLDAAERSLDGYRSFLHLSLTDDEKAATQPASTPA